MYLQQIKETLDADGVEAAHAVCVEFENATCHNGHQYIINGWRHHLSAQPYSSTKLMSIIFDLDSQFAYSKMHRQRGAESCRSWALYARQYLQYVSETIHTYGLKVAGPRKFKDEYSDILFRIVGFRFDKFLSLILECIDVEPKILDNHYTLTRINDIINEAVDLGFAGPNITSLGHQLILAKLRRE